MRPSPAGSHFKDANILGTDFCATYKVRAIQDSVLATSEVIPSRAMRALEGEGRGLSHLEVVARGAVVAPASQ